MKNIILALCVCFFACKSSSDTVSQTPDTDWLIPSGEVLDGGPGKDGIPSVDSPNFSAISNIEFLNDQSLVIGIVSSNGTAKAYPHPILDWHEIVNDEFANKKFALTYCPLTGTGIAWDRNINGKETTFGVSGKLYNTNLMPYDRETDSYWSQIRMDCVNGSLINTTIETHSIIETTWATWKKLYPQSQVMNTETGFSRDYQAYPYGDYRTNHSNIIFPLSKLDERLPAKERVLALLSGTTKRVYSINLFEEDRVIEDTFDGKEIIVIGSKEENYIVAFEKSEIINLAPISDMHPFIAQDENGSFVSIAGRVLGGPLTGTHLNPIESFMGYWMAFGAFYEGIEIYED